MKKIWFVILCIAMTSHPFSSHGSENQIVNPGFENGLEGWQAPSCWQAEMLDSHDGERSATIQYTPEHKWRKLIQTVEMQAGKYYRLRFYSRSDIPQDMANNASLKLHLKSKSGSYNSYPAFPLYNEWAEGNVYFYSQKADTLDIGFYLQSLKSGGAWLDEVSFCQLDEAEINTNMIQNSDFENGAPYTFPPHGWTDNFAYRKEKRPVTTIILEGNTGFVPSGKSLFISNREQQQKHPNVTARSTDMPILPGRTYRLSVWLKGDGKDAPVILNIDSYAGSKFKHWYKVKTVVAKQQWRKHTFDVDIPREIPASSSLSKRIVRIKIGIEKTLASVWIDEVKFQPLEK